MSGDAMADVGKLVLGLAAAVGTALLVFARKHGEPVELPPVVDSSPLQDDPASRARFELLRWKGLNEKSAAAAVLLAEYWRSVGLGPQPSDTPWSAAFISHVAKGRLSPNAGHIGYARQAWKDRNDDRRGRYWAFQPGELFPVLQRGDILLRGRGDPVNWHDVEADTGHRNSHGDMVIEAPPGFVTYIGGNLGNTVSERTEIVTGLAPPGVFAVLRYMAPGIEGVS
jgi:hypothetical protein